MISVPIREYIVRQYEVYIQEYRVTAHSPKDALASIRGGEIEHPIIQSNPLAILLDGPVFSHFLDQDEVRDLMTGEILLQG